MAIDERNILRSFEVLFNGRLVNGLEMFHERFDDRTPGMEICREPFAAATNEKGNSIVGYCSDGTRTRGTTRQSSVQKTEFAF